MDQGIFMILALCVGASAVMTVTSKNVFHSAVGLSMCLLSLACLYFVLQAPFVGVIQVLVYIGGIITLFVFAIKLTARLGDESIRQVNDQAMPSVMVAGAMLGVILFLTGGVTSWMVHPGAGELALKELGRSLMTTYVLPFEIMSVLLLSVMIAAIVIGKAGK